MDERLQEMLDHYEIRKTLAEYVHGVDRMDEKRVASTYAEDSFDDHGPMKCPGPEFAKLALGAMKAGASVGDSHLLGQSLVKIEGDTAGAETYFIFVGRKIEDDGSEVLLQLGGRYVDRLVRENDRWKVSRRICVRDWSITHSVESDWMEGLGFRQGERTSNDPSFAVLGLEHSGVP